MMMYKTRVVFCNCDNCEKRLDGELANVIELRLISPMVLCDECTDGLNRLIEQSLADGQRHTYISETRQVF